MSLSTTLNTWSTFFEHLRSWSVTWVELLSICIPVEGIHPCLISWLSSLCFLFQLLFLNWSTLFLSRTITFTTTTFQFFFYVQWYSNFMETRAKIQICICCHCCVVQELYNMKTSKDGCRERWSFRYISYSLHCYTHLSNPENSSWVSDSHLNSLNNDTEGLHFIFLLLDIGPTFSLSSSLTLHQQKQANVV